MARIAVGGFQHETNTFAPQQATWEEFVRADAWPPLLRGPEMIPGVEGFNIPIAGAVKRLAELGHEVVPLAWAAAAPAGRRRAHPGARASVMVGWSRTVRRLTTAWVPRRPAYKGGRARGTGRRRGERCTGWASSAAAAAQSTAF